MEALKEFENAKHIMDTCPNSQLVIETKNQHIKLPPKYIGNVRKGVHKHLSASLSQQDRQSSGFPLAYNNVKVLQSMGKLISDQACIHFDIQADFIMFKPVTGCKLNGKVNKIGKRHIGCLVHNHFNAWVPHTSQTEKLTADMLLESEIEFTVQEIFINRNMLSIKGKFEKFISESLQDRVSSMLMPTEEKKSKKQRKKTAENDPDTSETVSVDVSSNNKKKKHVTGQNISADSCTENEESEVVSQELNTDSVVVTDPSELVCSDNEGKAHKKKKKHKKEKRHNSESNDCVVGMSSVNDSIASLSNTEPLFTSTQMDDVNNNDSEKSKTPKHKKKKKHKNTDESDDGKEMDLSGVSKADDNSLDDSGIDNSQLVQVNVSNNKTTNTRKRKHAVENGVEAETDMEIFSPTKKNKKIAYVVPEQLDSSADFEDSSKRKKEKKKKHKDKSK